MKVQRDTDNAIHGNDAMAEQVETKANPYLERFENGLTRPEVHLPDKCASECLSGERGCPIQASSHHQQFFRVSHGGESLGRTLCDAFASGRRLKRLRFFSSPPKVVCVGSRAPSCTRIGAVLPCLAALILVAGRAGATDFAEQTISTDRPGIPFGTSIVPSGHLQLETGLPAFENNSLPDGHSLLLSTPTYLRYGVTDDFEVQLASSPWNRLTTTQGGYRHSVSGAGDLQLGGKFALSSGGGAMPAVTLIGYVTTPTGNRNFSDGRPAYNLNAVASWPLTGSTSLTTMASFTRTPTDSDRHANSGTLALSLSHSFTSHLTAYAETGWFPGYTNTSSTALAGAGMTYLLTRHVQVDGFFDVGLNHDSPRSVIGTGV